MKKLIARHFSWTIFRLAILVTFISISCSKTETGLKDAFKEYFYIGSALNAEQILGLDTLAQPFTIRHFNSITNEDHLYREFELLMYCKILV